MKTWSELYNEIMVVIRSMRADILFFRGHGNVSWKLKPNISRYVYRNKKQFSRLENMTFFDYKTKSGALMKENCSSWDIAFSMQHHGLPTRLLDWSENFSVALYFALKGTIKTDSDCCVWILDPFKLNKEAVGEDSLFHPEELELPYDQYFIFGSDKRKKYDYEDQVVAISPLRHNPRLFNQHAGFTLHFNLEFELEGSNGCLKQIIIPRHLHDDAWEFLKLAGISEYSLFPDLDGLARDLTMRHYIGLDIAH